MSAITALVDTTHLVGNVLPFAPQLEVLSLPAEDVSSPFSSFFNAALNVMEDTNTIVAEFEQAQLDFATGRLDDILAVQMAQDRANNAINFTSQITSRIIESYREIMRMQI
ncbi:MAG: flagellar hook-basal body complex protein FliE [Defluviitaleaceae bacterium]|nr:flagellar hook-basal body complex protein FliE [Defluviitaleaceae bacterium]